MSNSYVRWRTNVSSSWKEPGSRSFSMRSRAVYLPRSCCLRSASGAEWTAASLSSWSWESFSSNVSAGLVRWVIGRRRLVDDLGLQKLEQVLGIGDVDEAWPGG